MVRLDRVHRTINQQELGQPEGAGRKARWRGIARVRAFMVTVARTSTPPAVAQCLPAQAFCTKKLPLAHRPANVLLAPSLTSLGRTDLFTRNIPLGWLALSVPPQAAVAGCPGLTLPLGQLGHNMEHTRGRGR